MKVAFTTLGCKVNQYESEAMAEKFIKDGYQIVDFNSYADVYVINTCTVTKMGEKKSRQMISRARRLNQQAAIAVVGCYSQISPDEVSEIPGVNVVLGSRNKGDIVYWVNRYISENKNIIQVSDVLKNNRFEQLNIEKYQNKTRAFLKIQDGCNRFCSYCLIPFARGAVCSKELDKIIEEVKELAANGFREIILSGIHTASYGVDFQQKVTLVDLLEEIDKIQGIKRIRIGSIDPTFFTEEVVKRISSVKNLCPHFHLSLQSGCNETLNRMNRKYTAEDYSDTVKILRDNIKDVSITTDVIVGFPGETEEEFSDTYKFLKEIKLSKMHIFKYSPREGTKAAVMINQVDSKDKDIRSNKLITLSCTLEKEYMNKFIGSTQEVLFEEKVKGKENYYEGYTSNYIRVRAKFNEDISGRFAEVKLKYIEEDSVLGEVSKII